VTNASTTVIVDLINVIIVIIGPTIAMMIGIDVIITMTTTATTDVTTIVTMTTMIGAMTARMIVMTTSAMIAETTDVMTDVAKTTHNHHDNNRKERTPPPLPKEGNPNGAFQSANQEINFIVSGRQATKSNRQN
jgi:hypothetical protein